MRPGREEHLRPVPVGSADRHELLVLEQAEAALCMELAEKLIHLIDFGLWIHRALQRSSRDSDSSLHRQLTHRPFWQQVH